MFRFISVADNLRETRGATVTVSPNAVYPSLNLARADSRTESILVYDADRIPSSIPDDLKLTISDARNGLPYLPPFDVTAAGGYVVRNKLDETELLLIFRHGVWDLPKGKLDHGESIEAAAIREVTEEVGATDLRITRPLGTTVHGYPDGTRYAVKTTHWFLMETTTESFTPQEVEQIEAVRWVPWDRARDMLGFETLRDHMDSIRR